MNKSIQLDGAKHSCFTTNFSTNEASPFESLRQPSLLQTGLDIYGTVLLIVKESVCV